MGNLSSTFHVDFWFQNRAEILKGFSTFYFLVVFKVFKSIYWNFWKFVWASSEYSFRYLCILKSNRLEIFHRKFRKPKKKYPFQFYGNFENLCQTKMISHCCFGYSVAFCSMFGDFHRHFLWNPMEKNLTDWNFASNNFSNSTGCSRLAVQASHLYEISVAA